MKNKRGIELSTTTIIILILAVIVLVLLAVAVTGGFGKLWKRITGVGEVGTAMEIDLAKETCMLYFNLKQKNAFCNETLNIKGLGSLTCFDAREGLKLNITDEEAKEFCRQ
ncbi:MAG: hypothetical protein QW244_00410 [Candidatus Pacearchaeota archaeon]